MDSKKEDRKHRGAVIVENFSVMEDKVYTLLSRLCKFRDSFVGEDSTEKGGESSDPPMVSTAFLDNSIHNQQKIMLALDRIGDVISSIENG